VKVGETIIAGNTAVAGAPDLGGPYNSLGYNFIGNGTGSTNIGASSELTTAISGAPVVGTQITIPTNMADSHLAITATSDKETGDDESWQGTREWPFLPGCVKEAVTFSGPQ
jgi:hypothetical protein